MFEQELLEHHIERQIIQVLMFTEYARFTDLRPPRVDSNLFSYHLKRLIKRGYVEKAPAGYTLSHQGMQYVDRVSTEKMKLRTQPKIITMLLLHDTEGRVLLQRRDKQPYINTWTLPYGKVHIEDASIQEAALREASEKLHYAPASAVHSGDCYIRVIHEGSVESTALAHIFTLPSTNMPANDSLAWVEPDDFASLPLAPAVEQIVARSAMGTGFFEEFTVGEKILTE